MDNVYFVSGIDTNVGKSYVTGYLAAEWNSNGIDTITQKLVQTGNQEVSEDIELHRGIMGTGFLDVDKERLTMPEIYSYPCSPHLAAEIDGRPIDLEKIGKATAELSRRFGAVLLEGAGGLMVPLTRDYLTIDYVADQGYPLILVTSGRLGSINHTLLSLEAVKARNIRLKMLVFNMYPAEKDTRIAEDTRRYLEEYLRKDFPEAEYAVVPEL